MDEFLSEKEQLERIREWWREHGWYLIGGVALGGLILFGWNRYQAYEEQRIVAASSLYAELTGAVRDRAEVQSAELVERIRADFPSSPYADQAGLLMASLYLDMQDTARALDELRRVLADTDDDELAMIVRVRLARVYLHLDRYEDALAVLDIADPGRFSGRYEELRGDVYLAQGDTDRARTAYQQAFNAQYTDVLDRNLLQMKLDDLAAAQIGAPADAGATEAPAAGSAANENGS